MAPVTQAREFDVVIERDTEGWYVASVPALRGCHTQARSLDELRERTLEAIELCLEVDQTGGTPLEFVGIQRIRLAS
ncbi:MAG: type II toxin-antitoxin system HicB family antitoxin [Holophagales bacterium]|nr:type II toxin-antitoxin system HicB family antitoxin [Holophagales bacterium]